MHIHPKLNIHQDEGLDINRVQGLTIQSCKIIYQNLQSLYNKHNYAPNHILNSNEMDIQTRKQLTTRVLAKRSSEQVYNTIPKSREWLYFNYIVNAVRTTFPRFYIFKGEKIWNDYLQLCKPRTYMVMQSKTWMTTFLFKEFFYFFKRSIPSGIFLLNRHLFIFNGHGSHVTLEAIEQA